MADEDRFGAPARHLGLEVAQGAQRPGGQADDGDEVDQAQQPQGDVRQGPHGRKGQDGAGVGGAGQQDPEGLLGAALAAQEVHVDLGVGVAAEHRGEHQDEDEHDHRPDGPRPQVLDDRLLGQDRADQGVVAGPVGAGGEQDEQAGGGAHDDGVDEHAEGLDEPLLDGVGHGGGARGVGHRAQAGLVGEQAAAHAVEHSGQDSARDAVERLVQPQGAAQHLAEHARQLADIEDDDDGGDQDVDQGHERGHHLGDAGDPLEPTQHNGPGQGDEGHAHHPRPDRGHGGAQDLRQGVGLHHDHRDPHAHNAHDGEGGAPGPRAQAVLDVVGGAAVEGEVAAALLEDLRQGRLDEARRHADQGHGPHPEQGARPAGDNGQGDAGDVADAHAGGQPHGEGLEGGDAAGGPGP